jgi:cell division transport system ATP-binding protein
MPGNTQDKKILIRMSHVNKNYGMRPVLTDISLDVAKNDFVFISGASGSGKTTLLKLLYLEEAASEGQIMIDNLNLSSLRRRQRPHLRRKFGIILQNAALIATKTVFDNVALTLQASGKKRSFIKKKVAHVLRIMDLEDKAQLFPNDLLRGERQRLVFARAVVGDPPIILADEPTGCLDEASSMFIVGLLKKYHNRGATVIVASHNKKLFSSPNIYAIQLNKGKLQFPDKV